MAPLRRRVAEMEEELEAAGGGAVDGLGQVRGIAPIGLLGVETGQVLLAVGASLTPPNRGANSA